MSRRTHGALLAGVDVDVLVDALAIWELVDIRQREVRAGTCATSAPTLRVERRQHAVGGDAGLDLRGCRRTISCVEMLFLAIEGQLHRRFRGLREARTQDPFGADLRLAAEAAAHVLRDDTYVGLWNLETVGELLRRAVHGLRRDPGRQLVAFPFAHHRVA